MITFPKNPSNGMIFEAFSGLFFQYDTNSNCWVRVDGMDALGLATPAINGLMSSEDLRKINGLILPPPQASLKGEECPVTFSEGKVRLTSTDESMSVSPTLNLMNNASPSLVGSKEPWALHENTVGVNFNLNVEALLEEMRKSGKFTQVMIQGRQGPKGEKGDDGIDELDTGPQGEDGANGTNSPFDGSLGPEINQFNLADQASNRAVVDVHTEQNADGNFLVITRANIGNPNACPKEVKPRDITSPLILAVNQKDNTIVRKVETPNDCGSPCTICVTSLHHINIELIADTIFERFKERITQLKQEKEELVAVWIKAMMTVFNEQKASICCALENCRSAKRNERTRQYIETQRIQAAQGDLSLVIDGVQDRKVVDMDADKTCLSPGDLTIQRGLGCECNVQYVLDAKIHATDPRSLYLDRQTGLVDTGSDHKGVLNIHQEVNKPRQFDETGSAAGTTITRIAGTTTVVPPPQTPHVSNWKVVLSGFSTNVTEHPGAVPKSGTVQVGVIIKQNGKSVGDFSFSMAMIPLSFPALEIATLNLSFDQEADLATPLSYQINLTSKADFFRDEAVSMVDVNFVLNKLSLIGTGSLATIEMILKDDWNNNDYTIDGVQVLNPGLGFVQFSLPAGEYVAEIVDCCANVSRARSQYTGVAAIEYTKNTDATEDVATRETVFFPDLGIYNNNADARLAYLGSTVSFTHIGGQLRSWVLDPDLLASNNDGNVTICIRPKICVETQSPISSDTIFIYRKEISPLNLVGLIKPFNGDISAASNYGLGGTSSNPQFGPATTPKVTRSFFYSGVDGLSFFTIHGEADGNEYGMKMDFDVINNSIVPALLVSDDIGEVTVDGSKFIGEWHVDAAGPDGLAVGPFDTPKGGWVLSVSAKDLAAHQLWQAVSADGNTFNIAVEAGGIGTTLEDPIIFTPMNGGCLMPYKQVVWLERGHRTGAACSAVVELDGQKYIIAKRSIGDDDTCGGGESLANPCIALYLSLELGHPAIAWPTTDGEEFSGIPTSGYQGFVFDEELSNRVIDKIKAGDMENVKGDPATNIPFVIFPTSQ